MADQSPVPILPAAVAFGLRVVPLFLIGRTLEQVTRAAVKRHPSLFLRLGPYAAMTFLIDPTDLPFALRLSPTPEKPRVAVGRRPMREPWDARIAGPLAALLGMIHGRLDGDALFFSRTLSIEGNTEAILALRNAIDDAEIDLVAETVAALGPLGPLLDRSARAVLPTAERLTGVALSRAETRPA